MEDDVDWDWEEAKNCQRRGRDEVEEVEDEEEWKIIAHTIRNHELLAIILQLLTEIEKR